MVVGLGPAGPELLTAAARQQLAGALVPVWFRTRHHPAAAALISELPASRTFDDLYESHSSFDNVYNAISNVLLSEAATSGGTVTYAVPGSPAVAEASVRVLREAAGSTGVRVETLEGLSFCDLAWAKLGVDPVAAGVRLVDAADFAVRAAGDGGPLLVAQCWSRRILSEVKLALDEPAPGQRAVLLHHLGLGDEEVLEVEWPEIDRVLDPDHLTSLYVERLAAPVAAELVALGETVSVLRRQCPWDRAQSHSSLAGHLLEETYEALEALDRLGEQPAEAPANVVADVIEELGDLLCQVYFHATLGTEEGLFNLADVARGLHDKLVSRHPHVFGDAVAHTAADVLGSWERLKHAEKARAHLFEGIPAALPALARAAKFERKLASVGLGMGAGGSEGAGTAGDDGDAGGRLLRLARSLSAAGVDPETALRRALDSLAGVVARLEERTGADGRVLSDLPLETRRAFARELEQL